MNFEEKRKENLFSASKVESKKKEMLACLQLLSAYSLLESTLRIPDLVRTCKEEGYTHLALADVDHLYGTYQFLQECQKNDIQAIVGLTLSYQGLDGGTYRLLVLAKNNSGVQELYQLSLQRSEDGLVPLTQLISEHSDYLYYIIDPLKGEISHYIRTQQYEKIYHFQDDWLQKHPNLPYLGLAAQQEDLPLAWQNFLQGIGQTWPLVACQTMRYQKASDQKYVTVMERIQQNQGSQLLTEEEGEEYIWPASQWLHYYERQNLQAAILANQALCQQCHYTAPPAENHLPKYPLKVGEQAMDVLARLCEVGKRRLTQWNETYEQRLQKELHTIAKLGFSDYFLIVWDVLRFCRQQNILTSPGRGSVAGSLVAYLLYITDIDPLRYHLLFERFLNENRKGWPDIDLDFPDYRRNEVYLYMAQRYGKEHVARLVTFGTFKAKQAIRDVAKACGASLPQQNEWVQAIKACEKQNIHHQWTLSEVYDHSFAFRQQVNRSDQNRYIYDCALHLENLPKNTSVHAAGMLVSRQNLKTYLPLETLDEQLYLSQWSMKEVEQQGFLKFDFLALRNLSFMEFILQQVPNLNVQALPLDDPLTYQAFQKAYTLGIFQFESVGMQHLLQQIKVHSLEDLALVNALYRPGPNRYQKEVIERKEQQKPYSVEVSLRPILEETYGLMIYQEQVMQVAQVFADYTLAQADDLRRAMSKKDEQQMQKEQGPFIAGALQKGHSKVEAVRLFEEIAAFAGYGFNKAHAVAYSLLAYRLMYLKVHYPAAFFAAYLRLNALGNKEEVLQELALFHVHLQAPNINQSAVQHQAEGQNIRFGLAAIQGLDVQTAQVIVNERKIHGPYTSLKDFISRTFPKVTAQHCKILIEAGAFDDLNTQRALLYQEVDRLVYEWETLKGKCLFELAEEEVQAWTSVEQSQREYQRLGFYLTTYPLADQKALLQRLKVCPFAEQGNYLRLAAHFVQVHCFQTKKGETMAKIQVLLAEGQEQTWTVFPKEYYRYQKILVAGTSGLAYVKKQKNAYGTQYILQQVWDLKQLAQALQGSKLYIRFKEETPQSKAKVDRCLQQHRGLAPVIIAQAQEAKGRLLPENRWVHWDAQLEYNLKEMNANIEWRFQ